MSDPEQPEGQHDSNRVENGQSVDPARRWHDDPARRWHDDPARRWHDDPARRWHDMGGNDAGPVPVSASPHSNPHDAGNDFSLWEKRVDALMILGAAKGYFNVDGLRRVLEDMGEDAFETMTYYERWIAAVSQNLIEGGAYSTAELAEKMAEVAARGTTYGDAANGGTTQPT